MRQSGRAEKSAGEVMRGGLSLELHQGRVMVMTISVVMSVVHDLKITRHYPDMLNRHMKDQEQERNRSYERNTPHGSSLYWFQTRYIKHTLSESSQDYGVNVVLTALDGQEKG